MFEESKWVQVWKDILVAIFYKVTGVNFSLIFRKKEKMKNFGFYIEVMQCYKTTKNMSNGQVVGSIYE